MKKELTRKQLGSMMILLSVGLTLLFGLFFGIIIGGVSDFAKGFRTASEFCFFAFFAGCAFGGVLTIVLPKSVSDEFCLRAGYGIWYGTTLGAGVLKCFLRLEEITTDLLAVTFVISCGVAWIMWAKNRINN